MDEWLAEWFGEDSFGTHAVQLILSKSTTAVSGILFWWLAARFCSVEELGFASVFFSVIAFILFFSLLGIMHVFIRFLPESKERSVFFSTLLIFSTFLLLIFSGVFLWKQSLLLPDFPWLETVSQKLLFLVWTFGFFASQILEGLLATFKQTRAIVWLNVSQNVLRVLLLLAFGFLGGLSIIYSNGFAALLIAAFGFFLAPRTKWELRFTGRFHWRSLQAAWPFLWANFLNVAAIFLPFSIFPVLIYRILSGRDAGLFYLPWIISTVYGTFITCVGGSFLIKASHGTSLKPLLKKAVIFAGFLAGGGTLLFGLGGFWILRVFKSDFAFYATPILRILSFSFLFFSVHQIYIAWANARKDAAKVSLASSVMIIAAAFFTWLFLPMRTPEAFAWAWLAANVVTALCVGFLILVEWQRGTKKSDSAVEGILP